MRLQHRQNMWMLIFLIITPHHLLKIQVFGIETINGSSIWPAIGRTAGFLLQKCLPDDLKDRNQLQKDNFFVVLQECLKRRGLRAIDRALSHDIIEISEGVVLFKWKNDTEVDDSNNRISKSFIGNVYLKESTNWSNEFLRKIVAFLKTRMLRINLKVLNVDSTVEGRGRRKNNMFGQLMMFGLVAAGLIVIPLGFQFLAVLGGKALLLAKLALLLTSIQGLKRIATSNVNYGLYSTGHGGAWQYDRQWPYDVEPYSTIYSSLDTPSDQTYHTLHPRITNVHSTY